MLTLPVSVDIAIFRVLNKQLQVLIVRREQTTSAYPDQWCLPGGVVQTDDPDLLHAVHRTLRRRIGSDLGYVEQVSTHGNATRDPRGWSMTTLYFALVAPHEQVSPSESQQWVDVTSAQVRALAFDHTALLQEAITRLRNKAAYSLLPAYLLPNDFTYTELQDVYECILGMSIDKSKFRTKLKGHPDLVQGQLKTGVAYRAPVMLRVSPSPSKLVFPAPFV